ncbi:MAG: hypothetical protein HY812_05285 [Planctomycetes bacterium]|nr:hypothetical protein [Planctomycetota bacterium]
MSVFSKLASLRHSVRSGVLARTLAVLLGGTLNQKVIVILGLAIVLGSVYYLLVNLWQPLICGAVGMVFIFLAMRDYERSTGNRT